MPIEAEKFNRLEYVIENRRGAHLIDPTTIFEAFRREEQGRFYEYDAVALFTGGIQQHGESFSPTIYRQNDQFGSLGGRMRVIAAVGLYLEGKAKRFIISGGRKQAVNVNTLDPNTPTEGRVNKRTFLRYINGYKAVLLRHPEYREQIEQLEPPEIILDGRAGDTKKIL